MVFIGAIICKVCDTWSVLCPTYGYRPSFGASPWFFLVPNYIT